MKKLILTIMIALLGVGVFAQSERNQELVTAGVHTIVDTVDLTSIVGTDTTYYVLLPFTDFTWTIDAQFSNISGTGSVDVVAAGTNLTFESYNGLDVISITSTDTTYKAQDCCLAWYALGLKVTKPTSGQLDWLKIILKR